MGFIQKELGKGIAKVLSKTYDKTVGFEKPKPKYDYWGEVLDDLKGNKKKDWRR